MSKPKRITAAELADLGRLTEERDVKSAVFLRAKADYEIAEHALGAFIRKLQMAAQVEGSKAEIGFDGLWRIDGKPIAEEEA